MLALKKVGVGYKNRRQKEHYLNHKTKKAIDKGERQRRWLTVKKNMLYKM